MALAIKPLKCNGSCRFCYESKIVEAGGAESSYDIEAAMRRLQEFDEKHHPSIHGGEPLLLGKAKMERLLRFCYDKWKSNGIQTNGLLIDDDWITLFKRYNTSIGISIDGDTAKMNQGRWNKTTESLAMADAGTAKTMEVIKNLISNGIRVSIIIVLRKHNASSERLGELLRFILALEKMGIRDIRTNPGIVFDAVARPEEELTEEELATVFTILANLCYENSTRMWQPYRDAVDLVLGYTDATCIFTGCDPHYTQAEIPILANGELSVCLKASLAIEGIAALRADSYSSSRQEALQYTPQEDGGCAECEYWRICHGGCPGEGIDNDFRNRTRFCNGFKRLFEVAESCLQGLIPNINKQSDHKGTIGHAGIVQNIAGACGSSWRQDRQIPVVEQKDAPGLATPNHGDSHGDEHGDRPHGDHSDNPLEVKK